MKQFIGKQVIVRADRAGVFFGTLKEFDYGNNNVIMTNCRKIYNWEKAYAVEQIANDGVGTNSKLTVIVEELGIMNAVQILPCTEKAIKNLSEISVWKH